MVFVRIKHIHGIAYAYLVKNVWNKEKKQSQQRVIHYMGKVKYLDKLVAKRIFERDQCCQHCETMDDLTIDHIIPLSKGGLNDDDNLQVLCRKCNNKKGDKGPDMKDFYW